jgi:hypothetical protein
MNHKKKLVFTESQCKPNKLVCVSGVRAVKKNSKICAGEEKTDEKVREFCSVRGKSKISSTEGLRCMKVENGHGEICGSR